MAQTYVLTPPFRVSYPNVFRARINELNGKEEYSVVALFKKGEDFTELKKAMAEAMEKKFGPKEKWPKNFRSPLRDQEERAKDGKLPPEMEAGAIFSNLKTERKPPVVDQKKVPIDQTEFYPGCWARAYVSVYAYDMKGNKGVSFGLQALQKVKDDEPLGGVVDPEKIFSALETSDPFETEGDSALL